MPISNELLLQLPITHDESTAALNELVRERALFNRRRDADAREAAAQQRLADILAEEAAKTVEPGIDAPAVTVTPVRKGKKEK